MALQSLLSYSVRLNMPKNSFLIQFLSYFPKNTTVVVAQSLLLNLYLVDFAATDMSFA
jgi:hypothetical protein